MPLTAEERRLLYAAHSWGATHGKAPTYRELPECGDHSDIHALTERLVADGYMQPNAPFARVVRLTGKGIEALHEEAWR